jgi:hypothetical protein
MLIRKIESVSRPELTETYLDPFMPLTNVGLPMMVLTCGHEVPISCQCAERCDYAECEKCTLLHEETERLVKTTGQFYRDFWI